MPRFTNQGEIVVNAADSAKREIERLRKSLINSADAVDGIASIIADGSPQTAAKVREIASTIRGSIYGESAN